LKIKKGFYKKSFFYAGIIASIAAKLAGFHFGKIIVTLSQIFHLK
jgi:hypothetical protein